MWDAFCVVITVLAPLGSCVNGAHNRMQKDNPVLCN